MPRSAFTRREFVHGSLALMSTIPTVPGFLHHSALALAAPGETLGNRPGKPDDRILVVVQLSGGNDGLNTVIPVGDPGYYKARPSIAIAEKDALTLTETDGLALHPALAPLRQMYDDGQCAIVQGVGYPNPNRSHFASMDIWHTGDTLGGRGVGWVGGAMDELARKQPQPLDATTCICLGRSAPLAANGKLVKPVAFENAQLFRWVGSDLHPLLGPAYDQINRAGILPEAQDAAAGDQAAFVMRTALDAQIANDRIRAAVAKGPQTSFPSSGLANQLKMVAAMIRAELPTRVYYVGMGGFDTHANQSFTQQRLLSEYASAVQAFYAELKALRQDQRVLTLTFSEFGRRVQQNASNGTDHGTAGPVFLAGPMVQPGVHGARPSLGSLDDGDLKYTVDFRTIYAAILDNWMKIDSQPALRQRYQPAAVLRA